MSPSPSPTQTGATGWHLNRNVPISLALSLIIGLGSMFIKTSIEYAAMKSNIETLQRSVDTLKADNRRLITFVAVTEERQKTVLALVGDLKVQLSKVRNGD